MRQKPRSGIRSAASPSAEPVTGRETAPAVTPSQRGFHLVIARCHDVRQVGRRSDFPSDLGRRMREIAIPPRPLVICSVQRVFIDSLSILLQPRLTSFGHAAIVYRAPGSLRVSAAAKCSRVPAFQKKCRPRTQPADARQFQALSCTELRISHAPMPRISDPRGHSSFHPPALAANRLGRPRHPSTGHLCPSPTYVVQYSHNVSANSERNAMPNLSFRNESRRIAASATVQISERWAPLPGVKDVPNHPVFGVSWTSTAGDAFPKR